MSYFKNKEHWDKLKEFIYIVIAATLVGGFSLQGGNAENYERAIWVGSFVFSFYYLYTGTEGPHKLEKSDTIGSRIVKTFGFLLFVVLMTVLIDMAIRFTVGFDACEGWGEAEKYCAIQSMQDEYKIDNSYDEY